MANVVLLPGYVETLVCISRSGWQTRWEGVELSKYPVLNWGSAQAPALQAITVTTRAPCAAGRVESGAALPYLSPPLSCLSQMTARKADSSQYVLEMCLVTWNIHLLACSLAVCIFIYHIFFLWYLWPVQRRDRGVLELIPSMQPLMGDARGGGGDAKIRGADHQNQGLFLI